MKMPPAWKVKRELLRLNEQIQDLVLPRLVDRLCQARHDRFLDRLLRETSGALALTARVAVFVLFQPKGIAASTLLTLDHMAGEGWSVLIVSNAPLSEADRVRLAAKSAHIIERPNTGYDFGAYREGWRWLDRHGQTPDRLILMNDSTWFPLRQNDDSLRRMEALGVDLAGHIFKTEKSEDKGRDHLESHLLMLGPRALAHPVMRRYRDNYLMSNSKALTIRRGEKGITQAAFAAGLSVKGLLDRETLRALVAPLSDPDLLYVLRSLALHSDAGRRQREVWVLAARNGLPWREVFLDWISHELTSSRQHLLSATFIDPAMSLGGMGFLKKSNERRFHLARLALMRGIKAGRIPPLAPAVEAEVWETIRSWTPPQDWRAHPNESQTAEL